MISDLFFFHNAKAQIASGTGPYFYLPKLESHQEARLWNDVFVFAQEYIGIPKGTIRATVLIETITAAFEMDEILYELRDHSAGLNCGRWDYIFSFIKKFRNHASHVLPDRGVVTMEQPFLRSYVELLIHTCHRRGIHAMGGMAAQIPIRNNPEANEKAMERVRQDKLREVRAGHDGTWVAHPGLVPVAKAIFDEYMPAPNQIAPPASPRSPITAANLLELPKGQITEAGLRRNIDVGLQYLEVMAARQRVRPDLRLDGGRGDSGNFPFAALAMDPLRRTHGRWAGDHAELFDQILREVVERLNAAETTPAGSQVRSRGRTVYHHVERRVRGVPDQRRVRGSAIRATWIDMNKQRLQIRPLEALLLVYSQFGNMSSFLGPDHSGIRGSQSTMTRDATAFLASGFASRCVALFTVS